MVDALRHTSTLIDTHLASIQTELARLEKVDRPKQPPVELDPVASGVAATDASSRGALSAMVQGARAALRGKTPRPLGRKDVQTIEAVRVSQHDAASLELISAREGLAALAKLGRGLKELEGTELEGIIPSAYLTKLSRRWHDRLVDVARGDIQVLTGSMTLQWTIGDVDSQAAMTSLRAMFEGIAGEEQLDRWLLNTDDVDDVRAFLKELPKHFGTVAKPIACPSCGSVGCVHGATDRMIDPSRVKELLVAIDALAGSVKSKSALGNLVTFARERIDFLHQFAHVFPHSRIVPGPTSSAPSPVRDTFYPREVIEPASTGPVTGLLLPSKHH